MGRVHPATGEKRRELHSFKIFPLTPLQTISNNREDEDALLLPSAVIGREVGGESEQKSHRSSAM
ncbi:MAG: hypothetical protein AB7H80_14140 [Candidatus Kapaibacterium sp.]